MKSSRDDDVELNSPLKPVDHPDPEDDKGLMKDDKEQRKCNAEEKDQKYEDEPFGTPPVSPASEDETPSKSMYSYIQGLDFLDKIKEKLSDPVDYQDFLKCLHIYGRDIITKQELQLLVGDILGESADLMKGFNDFLSLCENHQKWLEESC